MIIENFFSQNIGDVCWIFIIGQRGVGKTTFLQGMMLHIPDLKLCDLDEKIESIYAKDIKTIFNSEGEQAFRIKEIKVLTELIEKESFVEGLHNEKKRTKKIAIALGAGFRFELFPWEKVDRRKMFFLWIRRSSDNQEKFFLDRPVLDEKFCPVLKANYVDRVALKNRIQKRQVAYAAYADFAVYLRESPWGHDKVFENQFYNNDYIDLNCGFYTLSTEDLNNSKRLLWLKNSVNNKKIFKIEIRDDLLKGDNLLFALGVFSKDQSLLSLRDLHWYKSNTKIANLIFKKITENIDWDLALELKDHVAYKELLSLQPKIISKHDRNFARIENFFEDLDSLASCAQHLKASPVIKSFDELILGHMWFLKDPNRRSFLPRSDDTSCKTTNFSWYRLLHKKKMRLNFFKIFNGLVDQPYIQEFFNHKSSFKNSLAVLGSDVEASYTPVYYERFLKNINFIKISLEEKKISNKTLEFLKSLGVIYFAVTSPFKKDAFELSDNKHFTCVNCESANTLVWNNNLQKWTSFNSDVFGMKYFVENFLSEYIKDTIVVWGGGGTLKSLKNVLPKDRSVFFSSRDARPNCDNPPVVDPALLIWAAGHDANMPPKEWDDWNFKCVWDLSYRADSVARDFAFSRSIKYFDGSYFFLGQATKQREYMGLNER